MQTNVSGTYQNGQIVLQNPVDWPDGARVDVALAENRSAKIGLTEDEWLTDPESIAQWLKWYDSLQPLEFTPQEEADLASWRKQVKQYDMAKTQQRIEGLFE